MALGDSREQDEALEVVLVRLQPARWARRRCSPASCWPSSPGVGLRGAGVPPAPARRGRIGRFRRRAGFKAPPSRKEPSRRGAEPEPEGAVRRTRPSRLLGEAVSLDAEVDESGQHPRRAAAGQAAAGHGDGRARSGCAASGGRATAYRRDYYRVHFEGLGPVWISGTRRTGGSTCRGCSTSGGQRPCTRSFCRRSNFSFLRGASHPEELVATARSGWGCPRWPSPTRTGSTPR